LLYLNRDSKDGSRKLLTQATDFIAAGNRAEHVLPRVITNPTIPGMLDVIFGKPHLAQAPAAKSVG
jgi:hypothetical protein